MKLVAMCPDPHDPAVAAVCILGGFTGMLIALGLVWLVWRFR